MDLSALSAKKTNALRLNLSLAVIEGMFVLWTYLIAPSEAESVVFLRYSALRLALLLSVLSLLLGALYLLVSSFKQRSRIGKFVISLWDEIAVFWVLLVLSGLMFYLIFASSHSLEPFTSYRDRVFPILVWFGLVALQVLISFILVKGFGSGALQVYRNSLIPSGVAILLLALLVIFIALTRIGLIPDQIYWQGPGAPLMLAQVVVAAISALIFSLAAHRFGLKIDPVICAVLWALAVFLWWSQPARISYNVLMPNPPNFQQYPFGDAILYDTAAHEYLAGTAFPNDFWVKPLYSFFLAFLHLFAGENYERLVFFQIVILGIIPVFVYLLVSLIGNRTAGILASLLVILREKNSITLSNVIQVSHLKLLLSDVFSMGLVVLLLWFIFRWFEKPNERRSTILILGGVLGLLTLTRGHPILLFPVLLVIIILVGEANFRRRFERAGMFAAGVALVLLPWFLRIYQTTGHIALQSPVSPYSANMAGLYSLTPQLANPEAFTTDVSSQTLEASDAQNKQVVDFIVQHPKEVFRFVSAHFFHNVIYSYIYLPQSFRIESLRAYIAAEPFWGGWQGELSSQGWALLFINITMIALGFGTVWKKHKFLALVPLLIGMGYNASVSVGRISGWRFILPADWITLVYFSVGLIQFSYIVRFVVTRSIQDASASDETQTARTLSVNWVNTALIAIFLLFLGSAVTYGNRLFSNRYPIQSDQKLISEYLVVAASLGLPFAEDELNGFIQSNNAAIVYGRAIYPYYLKSNSGPINHAWPAYKPRPYDRLVFYLVGPESMNVVLPISSHNFDFPDGANAIVLGCKNEFGDVEALTVLLVGDSPSLFIREPLPDLACPFLEPD